MIEIHHGGVVATANAAWLAGAVKVAVETALDLPRGSKVSVRIGIRMAYVLWTDSTGELQAAAVRRV